MPFAGYKDFKACVAANQNKRNPEAYCGKIKHQVEGKKKRKQKTVIRHKGKRIYG